MSDDIPTPVDESSSNFQMFKTLRSLEPGDTVEFDPDLAPREVIDIDQFHNGIVLTLEASHNQADIPVTILLFVNYEIEGLSLLNAPEATVDACLNGDPETTAIGDLTSIETTSGFNGGAKTISIDWTPADDIPFPAAPSVNSGPIGRPEAVIDDFIDHDVGFLDATAQNPHGEPATTQMFYLRLTNYGVAKVIPSNLMGSQAEVDISTASHQLEDGLKDAMDRRVRLALEQQGEVPLYLLDDADE